MEKKDSRINIVWDRIGTLFSLLIGIVLFVSSGFSIFSSAYNSVSFWINFGGILVGLSTIFFAIRMHLNKR